MKGYFGTAQRVICSIRPVSCVEIDHTRTTTVAACFICAKISLTTEHICYSLMYKYDIISCISF